MLVVVPQSCVATNIYLLQQGTKSIAAILLLTAGNGRLLSASSRLLLHIQEDRSCLVCQPCSWSCFALRCIFLDERRVFRLRQTYHQKAGISSTYCMGSPPAEDCCRSAKLATFQRLPLLCCLGVCRCVDFPWPFPL
ncbi:unnamed protein product [Effrenium voratum]|nr:unnamed protein product [Effrenium voratum]